MTRKSTVIEGITIDGLISVVTVLLAIVILATVIHYGTKLPAPEAATPPYPWIVLHGAEGGADEYNSWKLRIFYFVEQSHAQNPVFTDSLFKMLGLTYQMTDSTFIGVIPSIQQNVMPPNAQ